MKSSTNRWWTPLLWWLRGVYCSWHAFPGSFSAHSSSVGTAEALWKCRKFASMPKSSRKQRSSTKLCLHVCRRDMITIWQKLMAWEDQTSAVRRGSSVSLWSASKSCGTKEKVRHRTVRTRHLGWGRTDQFYILHAASPCNWHETSSNSRLHHTNLERILIIGWCSYIIN